MKKVLIGCMVCLFFAGVVLAVTSVSIGEKDLYVELQARQTKAENLLADVQAQMNAAVEVENIRHKDELTAIQGTYQSSIDSLRNELKDIEDALEGIK